MPDPGITRPDLCSIRAAAEQAEHAEPARGGLTADGHPPAGDYPPAPPASGTDRAIRFSTAAAVLAVAGIAAYVSYGHAYAVVRAHGETGITARLEPATIDGLVYASSMVVLYAARHRVTLPSLARWLLALGIAATLTVNMAQGWSHGLVGAMVAAWPAASLVGSYELLVWLIRTSGAAERGPSAEHLSHGAARRAAVHPLPAPAIDGERSGTSERSTPGPAWRPAGQTTRQATILASGQRADEVPEAGTVNDAAVAAYRLSMQAGNPLSERRLAQMFGRTSRRWARARIADARRTSPLQDSPSTLVPACADGFGRSAGQALPGCSNGAGSRCRYLAGDEEANAGSMGVAGRNLIRLPWPVSVKSVTAKGAHNHSHVRPQTTLATCRAHPDLVGAGSLHPDAQIVRSVKGSFAVANTMAQNATFNARGKDGSDPSTPCPSD